MDSGQIHTILTEELDNEQVNYLGVFPRDRIPITSLDSPCCLVHNTDPYGQSGTHWVAIYKDRHNRGFYFDSFGIPPQHRESKLCLDHCKEYYYNKRKLQSIWSTVCGQYCIFFVTHMARGYSMDQIIKFLNDNNDTESNDTFVNDYITTKYNIANLSTVDYPFILKQISKSLKKK